MLTFETAESEQYDAFMRLMLDEAKGYLETAQKLMHMSMEEFDHLFRTLGRVYAIYDNKQCVGFYWIEERESVLHVHALILKQQFQGRGIGRQVLNMLAAEYNDRMKFIELGVHESNGRAIRMYERNGFSTVKRLDDLRFLIMRKQLQV